MTAPIAQFVYTAPYGTLSFECYGTYDSYQSSLLEYCINLSDMENVKKLFHHCQLTNQTITIVESTPFEDKYVTYPTSNSYVDVTNFTFGKDSIKKIILPPTIIGEIVKSALKDLVDDLRYSVDDLDEPYALASLLIQELQADLMTGDIQFIKD